MYKVAVQGDVHGGCKSHACLCHGGERTAWSYSRSCASVVCTHMYTRTYPHTWGRGVDIHTQFWVGIYPRVHSQTLVFAASLFPMLLKTDHFHYGMSMK